MDNWGNEWGDVAPKSTSRPGTDPSPSRRQDDWGSSRSVGGGGFQSGGNASGYQGGGGGFQSGGGYQGGNSGGGYSNGGGTRADPAIHSNAHATGRYTGLGSDGTSFRSDGKGGGSGGGVKDSGSDYLDALYDGWSKLTTGVKEIASTAAQKISQTEIGDVGHKVAETASSGWNSLSSYVSRVSSGATGAESQGFAHAGHGRSDSDASQRPRDRPSDNWLDDVRRDSPGGRNNMSRSDGGYNSRSADRSERSRRVEEKPKKPSAWDDDEMWNFSSKTSSTDSTPAENNSPVIARSESPSLSRSQGSKPAQAEPVAASGPGGGGGAWESWDNDWGKSK